MRSASPPPGVRGNGGDGKSRQQSDALGDDENQKRVEDSRLSHNKPGAHEHDDAEDGEDGGSKDPTEGAELVACLVDLLRHSQFPPPILWLLEPPGREASKRESVDLAPARKGPRRTSSKNEARHRKNTGRGLGHPCPLHSLLLHCTVGSSPLAAFSTIREPQVAQVSPVGLSQREKSQSGYLEQP